MLAKNTPDDFSPNAYVIDREQSSNRDARAGELRRSLLKPQMFMDWHES